MEIKRIRTGRRVRTWIYRAYINGKPVRYKGMIISSDDKDSLIITTAKGMVIRTSLKNIRVMGRSAQGVRIVKLAQGDKVTDLVKVDNGGDD